MTSATPASGGLPAFSLADVSGATRRFPTGRTALLAFVKEDCPTCNLVMPLLEAAHRAFGGALDVLVVGQDAPGNGVLVERFGLTVPVLDDTALRVSFRYEVETVPTLALSDEGGRQLFRTEGFLKPEWQALLAQLAERVGVAAPAVDWSAYPELRPGCGSRSVEPGIAERLAAEAEGSPLRARRIEIGDADDPFEFMFDQGMTDGLPVVPPTPERVLRMLAGARRDPQDVVAVVPPNMGLATVEKVAANAVMAGCKPAYLPVVIAALEAVCADEFDIHGVMATTWSATPAIIVNGPIRHRLGMEMGVSALGPGNRANATIGRAVKLVLRNLGGARPGEIERGMMGTPAKYTLCFAEWEERSPWEPLHVERGFRAEDDVVTVLAVGGGPHAIADQSSRSARALAGSLALGLESTWHPKLHAQGDALLIVSPEHADTLRRDGWTKADLRRRVQEITARSVRELLQDEEVGEGLSPRRFGPAGPTTADLDQRIAKFRGPENIHIVVAGGDAGKSSAVFAGWVSGEAGSNMVSRKIEG